MRPTALVGMGLFLMTAGCRQGLPPGQPIVESGVRESQQLLVVTTSTWTSVEGQLRLYERMSESWKPVGTAIPIVVGPHGLAWGSGVHGSPAAVAANAEPIKREGDGAAPAGIFKLGQAFGYAAQETLRGVTLPYVQATEDLVCVDDPQSAMYNRVIDRRTVRPDWTSTEEMRRKDDLYKWGVIVEHNTMPVVRGGGSCIFLHVWAGPGIPTTGCTAMPEPNIREIMMWLDPAKHPLLVQLPQQNVNRFRTAWDLP